MEYIWKESWFHNIPTFHYNTQHLINIRHHNLSTGKYRGPRQSFLISFTHGYLITPFSALFFLFLFFLIICMKYEGLTSMIIKLMEDACYTTHYSLAVVCPAEGKICIVFKWARSIQTIVKIILCLCVFLYQLVKKYIIFYSTLGQHFSAIKWKGLVLILLSKESWPKKTQF